MERPLALVIDRDPTAREQIRTILAEHDVEVHRASSAAETTEAFRAHPLRLVILNVDTLRRVRIVAAVLAALSLFVVGQSALASHRDSGDAPVAIAGASSRSVIRYPG